MEEPKGSQGRSVTSNFLANMRAGGVVGFGRIHGSGGTEDEEPFLNVYDEPLPCCGCGIGWCSFLVGFLIPLLWFYGTYVFFKTPRQYDPRDRPGLAACAIAALACTVGAVIAGIVLLLQLVVSH